MRRNKERARVYVPARTIKTPPTRDESISGERFRRIRLINIAKTELRYADKV